VDGKLRVGDKVCPVEGTKWPEKIGRVGTVVHVSHNGQGATVKFPRVQGTFFYKRGELLVQLRLS
jgi:hypothetical protein